MEKTVYYAGIVEEYYNSACPDHVRNGYERNVLLDVESETCLFVSGDIQSSDDELIFRCKRTNGITHTTLKGPQRKKEKLVSTNKRYEGEVHESILNGGETATLVYQPGPLNYELVKTVKVTDLDYFLSFAMTLNEKYKSPYTVLQELEDNFKNKEHQLCFNCVFIPYYKDNDDGDYVFEFSHFERLEEGLCAVYEFTGTAK